MSGRALAVTPVLRAAIPVGVAEPDTDATTGALSITPSKGIVALVGVAQT